MKKQQLKKKIPVNAKRQCVIWNNTTHVPHTLRVVCKVCNLGHGLISQ